MIDGPKDDKPMADASDSADEDIVDAEADETGPPDLFDDREIHLNRGDDFVAAEEEGGDSDP